MKNTFWCGCCSLLIFVAKKAGKGTELQSYCTQGNLQGGREEDHRLVFTRQLHSPQFIKRISDVFNSLHPIISMHILHTVLHRSPGVLGRRICLTIKRFFS